MSARLENFLPEEKEKLISVLKKKVFVIVGIYAVVMCLSVAFIIYFNRYSENYYFQNNIEVVNVVFVVISVICGRMLVAEIIEYRKEIKSPVKKVAEAKILKKESNEITLGNKTFEESDFILNAVDFDSIKTGDSVRVELSAKSSLLFSIKKIS